MKNATVYAPVHGLPTIADLEPLAPGATIDRDASGRIVLSWRGLQIALSRMPDAQMGSHLQGLQGFVRSRGGGEALATRVLSTMSVYGFVIEPEFDAEGRAIHFLRALTAACDGLCFFASGALLDRYGRDLLDEATALGPPPAERVAARALLLLALAMRGLLDQDAGRPDEAKAEALRGELASWVERHPSLREELEPSERALLATPIGKAGRQSIVNAVWGAEGAQVLLFALGVRTLPAHDAQEHPFAVAREMGLLGESQPPVLEAPRLLSTKALHDLQQRLRAIHWRAVNQRVRPGAVDFAGLASKEFLRGVDLSGLALAEGDLAVRGVAFSKAAPSDVGLVTSIALERHRAANWLLGAHDTYSKVAVPT